MDAVLDIDPLLRIVERFGVVLADRVQVRLIVKYQGLTVQCDDIHDMANFALEAIRKHANPHRSRVATDQEAREAGQRMVEKHRASLEKLAQHDGPVSADAVDPQAGS